MRRIPMTWSRYTEYTDRGYLRIPGTDLQLNPFRGTVFMGGLYGMIQDFPEYESENPVVSQAFDLMQRMGFYPNILVQLGWLGYSNTIGTELGGLMPAPIRSLYTIAEKVIPNNTPLIGGGLERLRTRIGGRFWDYNVAELASQQCQERKLPYNGIDIWLLVKEEKIHPFGEDPELEAALTFEDEAQRKKAEQYLEMKAIWERAYNIYATNDAAIAQLGCMRYYSNARTEAKEEHMDIIEQVFGLSKADQRKLWMNGISLSQYIGRGYTSAEQELLQNTEWSMYWSGLTTPLKPYDQQLYNRRVREFHNAYENLRQELSLDRRKLDIQYFDGTLTWSEYNSQRESIMDKELNAWDTLSANPDWDLLPQTTEDKFKLFAELGLPLYGTMPMPAGESLLQELYFSLEPEMIEDWIGDQKFMRKDWDTYFAKRKYIDEIAEEWELSQEWAKIKQSKYDTPMDALEEQVYNKYLEKYWNMEDFILDQYFDASQQEILMQIKRGERETEEDSEERKMYSEFRRRVDTARERYRVLFPEADYWLRFFGHTTTFKSNTAESLWNQRGTDVRKIPEYAHFYSDYPLFLVQDKIGEFEDYL